MPPVDRAPEAPASNKKKPRRQQTSLPPPRSSLKKKKKPRQQAQARRQSPGQAVSASKNAQSIQSITRRRKGGKSERKRAAATGCCVCQRLQQVHALLPSKNGATVTWLSVQIAGSSGTEKKYQQGIKRALRCLAALGSADQNGSLWRRGKEPLQLPFAATETAGWEKWLVATCSSVHLKHLWHQCQYRERRSVQAKWETWLGAKCRDVYAKQLWRQVQIQQPAAPKSNT